MKSIGDIQACSHNKLFVKLSPDAKILAVQCNYNGINHDFNHLIGCDWFSTFIQAHNHDFYKELFTYYSKPHVNALGALHNTIICPGLQSHKVDFFHKYSTFKESVIVEFHAYLYTAFDNFNALLSCYHFDEKKQAYLIGIVHSGIHLYKELSLITEYLQENAITFSQDNRHQIFLKP